MEALEGFRSGRYEVMVATDIAARGIDVAGVSHVINYDVPENPEDYVHRIGRTGRAQAVGDAFTLATPENNQDVRDIERFIGREIPRLKLEGFPYKAASYAPRPAQPQRRGGGGGAPQNRAPSYHPRGKPGAHWGRR
jgi:ATP-dependent RNA helicase RhlE